MAHAGWAGWGITQIFQTQYYRSLHIIEIIQNSTETIFFTTLRQNEQMHVLVLYIIQL